MTYGSVGASPVTVWVVLGESAAAHVETAQALRAEVDRGLPGRVEWRMATAGQLPAVAPRPAWVVAVGAAALRAALQAFPVEPGAPPILAVLVPRLAYERMAEPGRVRAALLSAVFIDQPPGRQMDLIRLAMPTARDVGMLHGEEGAAQVHGFDKAARERGLNLHAMQVGEQGLFGAMRLLLPDISVLLAVPDPAVFNSQTAANILTTTYRRQIPLAGFSPAYVKAGALWALYSTPGQIGHRGGEILRAAMSGRGLAPAQWPREFTVVVNQDVARSLGMVLDENQLAEQLRARERQ